MAPRLRKRDGPNAPTPTPRSLNLSISAAAQAAVRSQHRQGTGAAAGTAHRPLPTRVPPKPAVPPMATMVPKTDEDIERMAKRLKAAHTVPDKLAPPKVSLPSTAVASARRNFIPSAAAPMPDLAAVSSESLFLRGLLATDLKKIKRCASFSDVFVRLNGACVYQILLRAHSCCEDAWYVSVLFWSQSSQGASVLPVFAFGIRAHPR